MRGFWAYPFIKEHQGTVCCSSTSVQCARAASLVFILKQIHVLQGESMPHAAVSSLELNNAATQVKKGKAIKCTKATMKCAMPSILNYVAAS